MIGYDKFGGQNNALHTLIAADDSEYYRYAKMAASETPKDETGKFVKTDEKGRPIKPEQEGEQKLDGVEEEPSETDEKKETPVVTQSNSKEIPFELDAYLNAVDEIVDTASQKLKERHKIQESLEKKTEKIINEMFRSTHDKEGNETEAYTALKGRANTKYIAGALEKSREKAKTELRKLFTELNNGITTTNRKVALKQKILQTIGNLKQEVIKNTAKVNLKLSQNELGLSVKGIAQDLSNAGKGIKKAVTQNTVSKKIADSYATAKQKAEADKPANDAKKAENKAVKDANKKEAIEAAENGRDGGITGKTHLVQKAVSKKLKDVWYGRKEKAAQPAPVQQVTQPVQSVPAQLVTQPVQSIPAQPVQPVAVQPIQTAAPPTTQADAIRAKQIKQQAQQFKPKPAEPEEEEEEGQLATSVDTDKIKKINKALRKRIK